MGSRLRYLDNLWLCTTGEPRLRCVQWVFLSVVETIVGWALCCSVGIVSVFSIFCITFLGDCTHLPHQKTIAIQLSFP